MQTRGEARDWQRLIQAVEVIGHTMRLPELRAARDSVTVNIDEAEAKRLDQEITRSERAVGAKPRA